MMLQKMLVQIGFWIDNHIVCHRSPYLCDWLEWKWALANGDAKSAEDWKPLPDTPKWFWR